LADFQTIDKAEGVMKLAIEQIGANPTENKTRSLRRNNLFPNNA
jgi:hypothetical protein